MTKFLVVCVLPHGHPGPFKVQLELPIDLAKHESFELEKLRTALILVVEDVRETGDGIERLLKADGYRVALARDEPDAIDSARLRRPDLILVSWTGLSGEVLATGRRIRERAAVGNQIPVVFWVEEDIDQGQEVAVGGNVHLTRPDSFNQLRGFLARLLDREISRVHVGDEFGTE